MILSNSKGIKVNTNNSNIDIVKRGSTNLAVKAGFWYITSTFLIRALAFLTTPIFARLMSPEIYGEFSNYASWQAMFLIIASVELFNTLNPAYYDFKDDYKKYISSITILGCFITLIIHIFFLCTQNWIYNFVSIPKQFTHILFFTLMCSFCKTVFIARERVLYRYKTVAFISIIEIFIPTIISVVLVIFSSAEKRLFARIYGYYLPSSIIGLICGIILIKTGKSFKLKYCRYALKLSLPLLSHYLTVYLLTSANTIVTKNVMGAAVTAVVSIVTSVTQILTILFQSLTGATTTWIMDNLEQKQYKKINKGLIGYIAIIVFISIGTILLTPEIVLILGGNRYIQAIQLVPLFIFSVLLQAICSMFTIILTYDKNVIKAAVYTGVIAIISIVLKVIFLPIFGLQVLAVINIISYILLIIINYILVYKAGYKDVINCKILIIFILMILLFTFISFILYKNVCIRYIIICIIGLGIITYILKNKNKLKKLNN